MPPRRHLLSDITPSKRMAGDRVARELLKIEIAIATGKWESNSDLAAVTGIHPRRLVNRIHKLYVKYGVEHGEGRPWHARKKLIQLIKAEIEKKEKDDLSKVQAGKAGR